MNAVFCGSFDPLTNGHMEIIERAARMYERLVVVVARNSEKHTLLPAAVRRELLEASVRHLPNVKVVEDDGLAVEAARKAGASVLVRGLRSAADADYECNMAQMNRRIAPEIETVCLFSTPALAAVSSTNVRELLRYGLPVDDLVPAPVNEYLMTSIARGQ